MTEEEKAEEYADKILSDSKYPFIFSKEKVKEYIIKVYSDSLKCCENAYKKGLAEGREEKCLEQNNDGTIRPCEVMKENEQIKAQIEKMKNIIYEEVDFCTYCPLTHECRNDEGTCPYANATEEEQKKMLTDWIMGS